MPTLSIPRLYTRGGLSDESHLTAAEEALETFFNTTKLDEENIRQASITSDNVASNAVTQAKKEAINISYSSNIDTSSNASSTVASEIGGTGACTVNITTSGRPVVICLQSTADTTTASGATAQSPVAGLFARGHIQLLRDGTVIAKWEWGMLADEVSGRTMLSVSPPGDFWMLDVVAAGSYSYVFQMASYDFGVPALHSLITVKKVKAVAYEVQ